LQLALRVCILLRQVKPETLGSVFSELARDTFARPHRTRPLQELRLGLEMLAARFQGSGLEGTQGFRGPERVRA
jgi:hypothetical protein